MDMQTNDCSPYISSTVYVIVMCRRTGVNLQIRYLLYEGGADRLKGQLRPGVEPVYGRTVDQGRELTSTGTQGEPYRGKTQDHL